MKKILFSAAFLAASMFSAQSAKAQSTFFSTEKSDAPISLGVRAGLNLSTLTGDNTDGFKTGVGFNAGVNVEIPVFQSLSIQTGLYLTNKVAKMEEGDYKMTQNKMYLQIPVQASYRYNFSDNMQWQVNAGPYIAYGIAGKTKDEEMGESIEYNSFSDEGGLKKLDLGLALGTGVTFSNIFVGVNYELGLTKINDQGSGSIKNSNLSINVGYNF